MQGRNRNASVDPRLAGINLITNGSPATFYVDLPSPGTYNLSLAMGDDSYEDCWKQCLIQFLDGNTVLATVSEGLINLGNFYNATGKNWSAAAWPANNLSQQVTLTGTRLTVTVGTEPDHGRFHPDRFSGSGAGLQLAELHPVGFAGFAQHRAREQGNVHHHQHHHWRFQQRD